MTIKAIETEYNGYKFRSRIEARWAIFFDCLNLQYQYEPEGFNLGSGQLYLPDFWLPSIQCWLEIKGIEPNKKEWDFAHLLAKQSGTRVFIAYGEIVSPGEDYSESMIACFPNGGGDNGYWFCECSECGFIGIEYNGRSDRLPCKELNGCKKSNHGDKGYNYETPKLINAYLKARQARFEHGETP